MEKLQLSEIKQIELSILKYFDTFCRENDISYFLSNGTLLGAIKYKGFILWDDDIDLLVPRKDYDRLISLLNSDGKFKLLCRENDGNFVFPYSKLCDTNTIITQQTNLDGYTCGVHIDIFPLDFWNDDIKNLNKETVKLQKLISLFGLSISRFVKGRNLFRSIVKTLLIIFTHIVGKDYYLKQINDKIELLSCNHSELCGCIVWPVYGEKEILTTEIFSEKIEVEFEGDFFYAPIGYDKYLRSLYGDYEQDPPLDRQKSHHSFSAYYL